MNRGGAIRYPNNVNLFGKISNLYTKYDKEVGNVHFKNLESNIYYDQFWDLGD
jgi:hypothetical protein